MPVPGRSGDDLYLAYTGGTTGQPKGVLWRHEDIFFAAMGGGDPTTALGPIGEPDELVDRIMDPGIVMLCAPPLVHVSAQWGLFQTLFGGGTVVLSAPNSIEPGAVWSAVADERVNVLTVVGDAMARPLLDDLAAHPGREDLSALLVFASGGAVLSPSSKEQVAALLPGVITIDGYGSTETGVGGARARLPGTAVDDTTRFTPSRDHRLPAVAEHADVERARCESQRAHSDAVRVLRARRAVGVARYDRRRQTARQSGPANRGHLAHDV